MGPSFRKQGSVIPGRVPGISTGPSSDGKRSPELARTNPGMTTMGEGTETAVFYPAAKAAAVRAISSRSQVLNPATAAAGRTSRPVATQ